MKLVLLLSLGMLGILLLAGAVDLGLDAEQKIHSIRQRYPMFISTGSVTFSGISTSQPRTAEQVADDDYAAFKPVHGPKHDAPPPFIKVGPFNYAVIFGNAKSMPHDMGQISFFPKEIHVMAGLRPDELRDTLIHEVMHASIEFGGMHNAKFETMRTEDAYIETVSPVWLMVIRDNPKFVAWLAKP